MDKLMAGIPARKFHYSKKESRDCVIRLSSDMTHVSWDYPSITNFGSHLYTKRNFKISKVQEIIYGPQSYTFRAYRLELLLSLTKTDSDADPSHFYGWECISFKLPSRTVDFVIKDPGTMMDFIFCMMYLSKA
jgi:hypothetical protein